ncbi:MAG: pyridoxal phosphate-dependent decarboxylase family protein [Aureispira sp.]
MNNKDFRQHAHALVDWMADYLENVEQYPVKSTVKPYEIYQQLPEQMPEQGEDFSTILEDFKQLILPGMTHWQHPNFHAYFPANSSYPSVLGEMLTATLGAQCMIWDTSPAAAELEERVLNWLKTAFHLPNTWEGVIQDTASTATLTALLSARERCTQAQSNKIGIQGAPMRVYCSSETHSSIEKAVKIIGLGRDNLVKIETTGHGCMNPLALEKAIKADKAAGLRPMCVVAALGTTGTTAVDPLAPIAAICQEQEIWLHLDAAFAGVALLLPEYRYLLEGMEQVDSFVTNAHKWLFTNFDCSLYYVKDRESLLQTFEILPEYLKTASRGAVNDYRDWGVPLGRRFRALKLWFVLRAYGLEGIQERLRAHMQLAQTFAQWIEAAPDFERLAPVEFSLVCFHYKPAGNWTPQQLAAINKALLETLNQSGDVYLTHTKIQGHYALRLVVAQTQVALQHIEKAWALIQYYARKSQQA